MPIPEELAQLIERFAENLEAYRSGLYKEAQLRQEFLDPFFKLLGWDVDNVEGSAEAYKDVIHEDSIKVGGGTEAPDYCFRIGGTRKFFVEAKKPSVYVKEEIPPAFQLRRYAWSAKLPLSILTDFEEFAVYDCRIKPVKTDKASTARIFYCTFREYPEHWDWIASIFTKEAIRKGSFDRFAESTKVKRGTAEVDKAFLAEIEGWREQLARNVLLRNPGISQRDLNFAVQKIIDRIVFLRICEDRGIEPYGRLRAFAEGGAVYERLGVAFHEADERYNSGLFHFRREKGRNEPPDELTPRLQVDDKILKEILRSLYYPESPYEFSVLPVDILGQVYEQFLGKVILLKSPTRAEVEEKPEVRKAGGVYYTPIYIVDYIVKHTVGPLLEGKGPEDLRGGSLRVLDPACGSGSFLLGAYQYLLDWHRDWYISDGPEKWSRGKNPRLVQTVSLTPSPSPGGRRGQSSPRSSVEKRTGSAGGWRLTLPERKRILLDHIFGVDIDPQAVEVTKLSLLIKVVEGETGESLENQRTIYHERALPDLGANIKCGNSLIGPDIYRGRRMEMFDEEELYRINAFDWRREFPSAISSGGFQAVIGNPPYIRIQSLQENRPHEAAYYKGQFRAGGKGNFDIYVLFVERGLGLLRSGGRLGVIVPSKFYTTDYGENLRQIIAETRSLSEIVDFAHGQVFPRVSVYTSLLFLDTARTKEVVYRKVTEPPMIAAGRIPGRRLKTSLFKELPWSFVDRKMAELARRLQSRSVPLSEIPAQISRGSSSGADDVFILRKEGGRLRAQDGETVSIEASLLRTPVFSTDFGRYEFSPCGASRILFPYIVSTGGYSLISADDLQTRFPKAFQYLQSRRKRLRIRKQFQSWWGFSAPRNLDVHEKAHILVPLLANRGSYSLLPDRATDYCLMASGGFSITVGDGTTRLRKEYILGILNSKLLYWRLRSISNVFRGGWITCTKQYVKTLPIRTIDFSDKKDKACHDRMVSLVERMLDLNKKLPEAKTDHAKTLLERQIEATDAEIDELVFDLYELTEEERRIVAEGD